MKKFFSLIALVGVFAACQPEDLTTVFQVKDAELTIKAEAVHAAPDFNKGEVAWTPGQNVTRTGNPNIEAGAVDFTAKYRNVSGSSRVEYGVVPAGWTADYNTTVVLPFDWNDYTFEVEELESTVDTVAYMLGYAFHGHGYHAEMDVLNLHNWTEGDAAAIAEYLPGTFEGKIPMLENTDDFILTDSYAFDKYNGTAIAEDLEVLNENLEEGVTAFFKGICGEEGFVEELEKETVKETFQVSAWALYNVVKVTYTTTTNYQIVAKPNANNTTSELTDPVVGTFSTVKKDVVGGPVEMAHPSHASHYQAGHGHGHNHGHGSNNNAGGGLVLAE